MTCICRIKKDFSYLQSGDATNKLPVATDQRCNACGTTVKSLAKKVLTELFNNITRSKDERCELLQGTYC
jgi:hypothetical protein